jgi:hypothetical protein
VIGFTRKRDERIKELEDENLNLKRSLTYLDLIRGENAHLYARVAELQNAKRDQREDSIRDHLKEIRSGEEIKRHEAKQGVSKEVIREMREAIKVAIVSIRNLARRRPNEVTAEHLSDLAAEAEKLVEYTDLPR